MNIMCATLRLHAELDANYGHSLCALKMATMSMNSQYLKRSAELRWMQKPVGVNK